MQQENKKLDPAVLTASVVVVSQFLEMGGASAEAGLPVQGFWVDCGVANDAVTLVDGVVEAGPLFAAGGGLDPEAELADSK